MRFLTPGANDVWVMKKAGSKDILIPYIEQIVKEVDISSKKSHHYTDGRTFRLMKIDVLSLFPEMFEGVFGSSILKKAARKEAVSYNVTNFRDYADNKHSTVDDYPYGGGAGMVLKPQPIFDAVEALKAQAEQTQE